MTDFQTTLAVSSVLNVVAITIGILINNARLSDLRHHIEMRFNQLDQRFDQLDARPESERTS